MLWSFSIICGKKKKYDRMAHIGEFPEFEILALKCNKFNKDYILKNKNKIFFLKPGSGGLELDTVSPTPVGPSFRILVSILKTSKGTM